MIFNSSIWQNVTPISAKTQPPLVNFVHKFTHIEFNIPFVRHKWVQLEAVNPSQAVNIMLDVPFQKLKRLENDIHKLKREVDLNFWKLFMHTPRVTFEWRG